MGAIIFLFYFSFSSDRCTDISDNIGQTPLIVACVTVSCFVFCFFSLLTCTQGNVACIKALVTPSGNVINHKDKSGKTALFRGTSSMLIICLGPFCLCVISFLFSFHSHSHATVLEKGEVIRSATAVSLVQMFTDNGADLTLTCPTGENGKHERAVEYAGVCAECVC